MNRSRNPSHVSPPAFTAVTAFTARTARTGFTVLTACTSFATCIALAVVTILTLLLGSGCVRLPSESNAAPTTPLVRVLHDPDFIAPLVVELVSTDPEGDPVCYRALVNGRQVPEEPFWSTFVPSGDALVLSLELELSGGYAVQFQARDTKEGISPASQAFDVQVDPNWILIDAQNWPLPSNRISALAVYGPTRFIGTADAGLATFDRYAGWSYLGPPSLPSGDAHVRSVWPYVWQGRVDPWVGTSSGGVRAVLNGIPTLATTANTMLPDNRVTCVGVGRVRGWIGTWGGGVAGVDTTTWNWAVFNTQNSTFPSDNVSSIAFGSGLWFGTDRGLARRLSDGWEIYTSANSRLPSDRVTALTVDKNGIVWVGTDSGVAAIQGEEWTVFHTGNSPLRSNRISALVTDASAALWIGTEDAGLARFGLSGWWRFHTGNSPLPSDHITALAYADIGWPLWIGTDQGLVNFSGALHGPALHGEPGVEERLFSGCSRMSDSSRSRDRDSNDLFRNGDRDSTRQ